MSSSQAALDEFVTPGAFPEPSLDDVLYYSRLKALRERRSEYVRPRQFRIRVGTWNSASLPQTKNDLASWFSRGLESQASQKNHKPTPLSDIANTAHPNAGPGENYNEVDIYVLGLQEIVNVASPSETFKPFTDPTPSNEWKTAIENAIPGYSMVSSQQLVGLLLLVYASPSTAPMISSVSSCVVGTGLMGYMGNKGAVLTRMVVGGTTRMVFVNSHLAAGADKASQERRNWDASQIVSRAQFSPLEEDDAIANQDNTKFGVEELAFWFGDFNYRIGDIPGEDVRRLLHLHAQGQYRGDSDVDNKGNGGEPEAEEEVFEIDFDLDPTSLKTTLNSLLPHDQLRNQQAQQKAFHQGWQEGEINFLPTYKYDVGTVGTFDSSEKQRSPSWCDRILFRTHQDISNYEKRVQAEAEKKKKDEEMNALGLNTEDTHVLFEYDPQTDCADDDYKEEDEQDVSDAKALSNDSSSYHEDEDDDAETVTNSADMLRLLDYKSFQEISSSDHKPVVADFAMSIDAVVPELKLQVQQEIARELDKAENEARPTLTVIVDGLHDENRDAPSPSKDHDPNVLRFSKIYYDTPTTRYLTVANTGGVPATFSFVNAEAKGENDLQSPPWIRIHVHPTGITEKEQEIQAVLPPGKHVIPPGTSATVDITVTINDIHMVRNLTLQKQTIEHVLVLRVDKGRDHFFPLNGNWVPTCFGLSLEQLTRLPDTGVRSLSNVETLLSPPTSSGGSAPRELLRLTEAVGELVERAVAEWNMTNEGMIPPWESDGSLGWPFKRHEQRPQTTEEKKMTRHIIAALDTNESFSDVFPPETKSHIRAEIMAGVLLSFLQSLHDGLVTAKQWKALNASLHNNEKAKATQQMTSRDVESRVMDILSSAPIHSVSFTFVTFMLTQIANEIAPVPSLPPGSLPNTTTDQSSSPITGHNRSSSLASGTFNPLRLARSRTTSLNMSSSSNSNAPLMEQSPSQSAAPSQDSQASTSQNQAPMLRRQAVLKALATELARVIVSQEVSIPNSDKERRRFAERKRAILEPFLVV